MRRALLFLWMLLGALSLRAADEIERKEIDTGVTYESIWRKDIPLKIHVLSVDLSRNDLDVLVRPSRGTRKLSEVGLEEEKKGVKVLGGVNGDYFFMMSTVPLGIEVVDGILRTPPNIRSAFLINNHKEMLIAPVEMRTELILANGDKFQPSVTNRWCRNGQSALYTIRTPTEWDPPEASICAWLTASDPIILNKSFTAKVKKIRENPPWVPNELGANELLLVEPIANAKVLKKEGGPLKEGDELLVRLEIPGLRGQVMQAIGGGPRIVRDGKKSIENEIEQMGGNQVFGKNPRVGLGYSKDGKTLKLFAIDGRKPVVTIGTDMSGMADIMIEHGVWHGMALDGGGSITMIAGGTDPDKHLVTDAQGSGVDDGERRISNALLIVRKNGKTEIGASSAPKPNGTNN